MASLDGTLLPEIPSSTSLRVNGEEECADGCVPRVVKIPPPRDARELKRIVESASAQIMSIQPLPPIPEDGLYRIVMRIELVGDTAQLARILYQTEAHRPAFIVTDMYVRANERPIAPGVSREALSVRLDVSGYARGSS